MHTVLPACHIAAQVTLLLTIPDQAEVQERKFKIGVTVGYVKMAIEQVRVCNHHEG